jgi:hypothetical protein
MAASSRSMITEEGRPCWRPAGCDLVRLVRPVRIAAVSAFVLGLCALRSVPSAATEFRVLSPIVDYGEVDFENNGAIAFGKVRNGSRAHRDYRSEIGLGLLPFWGIELQGHWIADAADRRPRYEATSFENYFQLTPEGKHWADLGFFFEYSHAARSNSTNSVTFGPLIRKQTAGLLALRRSICSTFLSRRWAATLHPTPGCRSLGNPVGGFTHYSNRVLSITGILTAWSGLASWRISSIASDRCSAAVTLCRLAR